MRGVSIFSLQRKSLRGVPEDNWLPINGKDVTLDIVMRIYMPDMEKMKTWEALEAEKL
jgi:hypothetical protein